MSFVYDIRMPKFFTDIVNSISVVVNLDFVEFTPAGSMAETSIHRNLVGDTLAPLFVFAAMLVLFGVTRKSKPEFANRVFR